MSPQENVLHNPLLINPETQTQFKDLTKWAKYLAILGFVLSGILVFNLLYTIILSNYKGKYFGDGLISYIGIFNIINSLETAGLFYLMSLYLFRFAVNLLEAIISNDQHLFNFSFRCLKSCFCCTIIYFVIYILQYIFGVFFIQFISGIFH